MNNANQQNELTSTLHLGVRSIIDSSAGGATAQLLSELEASDSQAVKAIIEGDGESAMLVIHRGPAKGARFLIADDRCSIGRSTDSAIFLDDVTVSRCHAAITRSAKVFKFEDLGSLNGSYVNNDSTQAVELHAGDEIQIGKFHLLFIAAHQINKK